MKNIHVLPTEKPSRFHTWINDKGLRVTLYEQPQLDIKSAKNIYITSDEEIKEGDWFYNIISLKPEPFKACENGDGYVNCSKYSHYRIDCKKIILTDNKDLIDDDVQAIDDEFLEWFVKNPSCDKVEVDIFPKNTNKLYGIIIPQEEPKQETLEEAAEQFEYTDGIYGFKQGAKWQAERRYNEEEVNNMFATLKINSVNNVATITNVDLFISSWKKQFKKK
jgi:hypothetical protein